MPNDDSAPHLIEKLLKAIEGVRAGDYAAGVKSCAEATETLQSLLAIQLTPLFKAHFVTDASEGVERKRELAREANKDLSSIGLAVRCPTTGRPSAFVVANLHSPRQAQFRLVSYPRDKDHITFSSASFPDVELIPRPSRMEGGRKSKPWTDDIDAGRGKIGRE